MATKRMPSIGSDSGGTSYPNPSHGNTRAANASLGVQENANAANFVEDPDVLNASPATKKSYSWNRGETGNAT